jgi:adenylylsulfate kinase
MTTTARAQGATVWLTGLPSAGKTTVARILGTRLKAEGHRVEVLDGDEVRRFLSAGLGFSREDRNTNVQRIGLVAEVLARNGVLAVVPVIAPYADTATPYGSGTRRAGRRTSRCMSPPRSRCAAGAM